MRSGAVLFVAAGGALLALPFWFLPLSATGLASKSPGRATAELLIEAILPNAPAWFGALLLVPPLAGAAALFAVASPPRLARLLCAGAVFAGTAAAAVAWLLVHNGDGLGWGASLPLFGWCSVLMGTVIAAPRRRIL
jgi:hypothetical protein